MVYIYIYIYIYSRHLCPPSTPQCDINTRFAKPASLGTPFSCDMTRIPSQLLTTSSYDHKVSPKSSVDQPMYQSFLSLPLS